MRVERRYDAVLHHWHEGEFVHVLTAPLEAQTDADDGSDSVFLAARDLLRDPDWTALAPDEARDIGRALLAAAEEVDPPPPNKPQCPRCGSARWVSVSLDGGYTRRAQCVPCGAHHKPMIGPGWKSARFTDPTAVHPDYRKQS